MQKGLALLMACDSMLAFDLGLLLDTDLHSGSNSSLLDYFWTVFSGYLEGSVGRGSFRIKSLRLILTDNILAIFSFQPL